MVQHAQHQLGRTVQAVRRQGRGDRFRPDPVGGERQHGPARAAFADRAQKTAHHGPKSRVQRFFHRPALDEFHKKAADPGAGQRADQRAQAEKERRQQNGSGNGPDHTRESAR